jgi:AraC-like DNA-binding protein/ligand-binding sensor domain-containing protein
MFTFLKMNQITRVITIFLFSISIAQANNFVFSPINVLNGLSDNQIRYILQLSDGRMVFKTSGNINIYDGVRFKYIHQISKHIYPLKGYDGFYRIYQSGDSLLWIKDNHKLMCVDLRTEKYLSGLGSYFKKKGFKKPVEDLFMDSNQRLWLLSSGRLFQYNSSESLHIAANHGVLQDLTSQNNNLYLFYNTGEVVCYDLKTKKKLYSNKAYPAQQQALFKNTSLVVKGNNGFYQLQNGNKGGFFFFDTRKRIWKKILETDYTLNTLVVNSNDTAYISCTNGIWIINCRNGEKQYLPTLKKIDGSILNTEISTVFYDKQNGLWLGTLNQGLLYYHPFRYKFTNIGRSYFNEHSTKDIIVQAFAEDEIGNIYVKCQSAIYQYHSSAKDNKILTAIPSSSVPKEVLKKFNQTYNHTASLTDVRHWKWTGTPDGLKLFDPNKKEEKIFYTKDGLSNNFVHALLEDRNHNIWVTTSYGITKLQIDPKSNKVHFTSFSSDEGTLEGEYSNSAAFEAADGTLYFGGINGFTILNPNNLVEQKLPFRPVFTNLFLRGEKIEAGNKYDGRTIMTETAPYTKEIELSYDQNFLTFEFSAVNYQNPSQTYYRYQLENIDKDWQETSIGRQNENADAFGILKTSYTNLPPGEYKLKVMASGSNRQWNGLVSELRITIHAPWWKTTTAYILFIAFFITMLCTGIYLYVYYTRKKLERSHKEDILLVRIRNLIDQCNYLEAEKETYISKTNSPTTQTEDSNENPADAAFLARALEQVEMNIDVPNYSVEQLSRDLCMDRTGLYRKLIALLDKSPSLFIRNIRLQRAADLILEGELSITEISEKVGFSSSSYLSKCFQEMYGCRPSEYPEKRKKST